MNSGFDYQGASYFIGALAGAIVLIGGFGLQVATFIRAGRLQKAVDGLGDKRVAMGVRAGTAEGHAQGIADERADPQTPSGA